MQIETQFTSGTSLRPSHPDSPDPAEAAGSAFSEEFLEALRVLAARARDGGGAVAARQPATQLAAVLPALAEVQIHRLGTNRRPRGYSLHAGRRFVGHVAPAAGRLSPERRHAVESHLDLARYLASHPHALALILESVGPEALPVLGRALARGVEALLPE